MTNGAGLAALVCLSATALSADPTSITSGKSSATVAIAGDNTLTISRDGAACPPACIQPMSAAEAGNRKPPK